MRSNKEMKNGIINRAIILLTAMEVLAGFMGRGKTAKILIYILNLKKALIQSEWSGIRTVRSRLNSHRKTRR